MTTRLHNPLGAVARTLALLLTLVGIAAVAAPSASATPSHTSSDAVNLNIYDAYLSQQCGVEVVATLSGTEERRVYLGDNPTSPARELTTFRGEITWLARASGKTYTDRMSSTLHISYPEGIELFSPARVTVTGRHGGTFPVGGGPAGSGVITYDATVYAEDQGFPYWFVDGEPVSHHGNFSRTTRQICAELT